MENLTFLLDRKLKKSLIPGKIYKSIHSEYLPLVGPVIDAPASGISRRKTSSRCFTIR